MYVVGHDNTPILVAVPFGPDPKLTLTQIGYRVQFQRYVRVGDMYIYIYICRTGDICKSGSYIYRYRYIYIYMQVICIYIYIYIYIYVRVGDIYIDHYIYT